jgi:hypothetical protein
LTRKVLNSGTEKDLKILGNFLFFLEKTGNAEARTAVMHVHAEEISRSTRGGTMKLMREIERSMYLQSSQSRPSDAFNGLIRALNYEK